MMRLNRISTGGSKAHPVGLTGTINSLVLMAFSSTLSMKRFLRSAPTKLHFSTYSGPFENSAGLAAVEPPGMPSDWGITAA